VTVIAAHDTSSSIVSQGGDYDDPDRLRKRRVNFRRLRGSCSPEDVRLAEPQKGPAKSRAFFFLLQ
jgi:hypothetical protein